MTLLRQTYLLLGKDLLLELRRRDSLLTMFFFGTLLLFVFHFAFDLAPDKIAELAPALLWLAFLFTGTLGLAQLFQAERDNHCLDALLLSPLDRGALFLAKTGFNFVLMLLVELVVIPLFWILFNLSAWNLLPQLFLVTFLGTLGFCVLGTITAGAHLARPGARAAFAAGLVSLDDSGNPRHHSLHGKRDEHRRHGGGHALAAAAHRIRCDIFDRRDLDLRLGDRKLIMARPTAAS